MTKHAHDAARRGRAVDVLAHGHEPESKSGDAIYVFMNSDAIKAGALVDLFGHWMLKQDAVDLRVSIELVDFCDQLFRGGLFGEMDGERVHADTAAGIAFHADVGGRRWVGADEDGGEDGGFSGPGADLRHQLSLAEAE